MCAGPYRVTAPSIAAIVEDGRYVAYTIPEGALITVTDEAFHGDGLVAVAWGGLDVLMFVHDLERRAQKTTESAA